MVYYVIFIGFALTKDEDCLQNYQKQSQVKVLERQIDQMVCELYDLTDEEIKIIEQVGAKEK